VQTIEKLEAKRIKKTPRKFFRKLEIKIRNGRERKLSRI
jgi:hypothetical protein